MTDILASRDVAPQASTALLRGHDYERGGADLLSDIGSCATRLHAAGLRPGDRVLLRGATSATYVVTLLALAHADASVVLVDHRQDRAETKAVARLAGARWLLTDTPDRLGFPPNGVVKYTELQAGASPRSLGPPSVVDLQSWWRRDDAVILCSSGTTGTPKCVVKSGRALRDNTLRTIQVTRPTRNDVFAPWLPFSHQYGLSVILAWWLTGSSLAVTAATRPDRAVADAVAHGATMVEATPSTYRTLVHLFTARPKLVNELSGVRSWGVGGEPLPRSVADDFRALVRRPLLDGYGLTEVGNVALATDDNPVGCGRPLPGIDVRVVDDVGRLLAPDHTGSIEVRTTDLMAGYLRPDGTVVPPPPGWYATNDLGYLDRDGNLHVLGRRHAVHRRGFTLYPESIGRRAEQCGRPVQVVTLDDHRRGCLLVFAVCDPSQRSAQYWRKRICELLPPYERPNRVHVLDEFPITPNGKVDRVKLRELVGGPARAGR